MSWRAIVVEFIEGLWDRGIRYLDAFLKPLHDAWYDEWVEWKTQETMKDVDRQIEELLADHEEVPPPVYTEYEDGSMRLTAPWYEPTDDSTSM